MTVHTKTNKRDVKKSTPGFGVPVIATPKIVKKPAKKSKGK